MDGRPLAARYRLEADVAAHARSALAYGRSCAQSTSDVYTTNAKIARYDLVENDAHFFPRYDAVPSIARSPHYLRSALLAKMPARSTKTRCAPTLAPSWTRAVRSRRSGFLCNGAAARRRHHIGLAGRIVTSIARYGPRSGPSPSPCSTLLGVPLGVSRICAAAARRRLQHRQTIPSLALFAPIRCSASAQSSARGALPLQAPSDRAPRPRGAASTPQASGGRVRFGLATGAPSPRRDPLASRTIVAGIKTSAIVAVGSDGDRAFIGAGFGEPISTGLRERRADDPGRDSRGGARARRARKNSRCSNAHRSARPTVIASCRRDHPRALRHPPARARADARAHRVLDSARHLHLPAPARSDVLTSPRRHGMTWTTLLHVRRRRSAIAIGRDGQR